MILHYKRRVQFRNKMSSAVETVGEQNLAMINNIDLVRDKIGETSNAGSETWSR